MLFIISTPIGHLDDLSKRALDTLGACDAILCEDTRRTSILMERYGLKKPLVAYHKFSEKHLLEKILDDLAAGRNLGLVSDAGTPCINDPGQILTAACVERKIPFTAIPGPCSIIQALLLSGFDTSQFQFIGFIPKKGEKGFKRALCFPGTTVAFESPERLVGTLEEIDTLDPKRSLAVAREMTKTFEECLRGTPQELITHFNKHPPRGEIVLVIGQGEFEADLSLQEAVAMLQEFHGLSLKEAIKEAAGLMKISKRLIYKTFHNP